MTDCMNDCLEEYYMQNSVKEELLPLMGETGATSSSELKPVDNRVKVSDEQLQGSQIICCRHLLKYLKEERQWLTFHQHLI